MSLKPLLYVTNELILYYLICYRYYFSINLQFNKYHYNNAA